MRLFKVSNGLVISSQHWRSIVWMLLVACWVAPTVAQQYRTDPIDEKMRVRGTKMKRWVGDPASYAAEKAEFDEYFDKYYFPDMTRAGEAELGHLGDARYSLFKRILWITPNAQLQQDLTAMLMKKMREFVTCKDPATSVTYNPPYHPALRYNAVLVIGMLDQEYAIETGAARRPPKPLPEANAFLTQIVSLAADDKPVPPTLLLGALIGLERHAQYHASLPPDAVAAMSAALLKLASHEKPIQDMDREAYAWIRMRAATALAKLGNLGDQNAVHNALIKMIAGSKSLDDRCEVAGLLDKFTYKDAKLDDAGTAEPLFALARDLAAAEDKRAKEFQDQFGGGTGPTRSFTGIGPGGTTDQETYPRRQVVARLTGLRNGLAKVKPGLPAETQKKVDSVLAAVDAAKTSALNNTVELKLAEAMRAMAVAINKAVPPPEKAGAKKADKAGDEFEKPPAAPAAPPAPAAKK